jgi:hypothetical protein
MDLLGGPGRGHLGSRGRVLHGRRLRGLQLRGVPRHDLRGPNPDTCVGTSASYGIFQLAPGDYSITITAVVSPFNVGVAYFRIDGDVVGPPPPPQDSDGDGLADSVDACPTSALAPTVIIAGCDSGVKNPLFDDGCTLTDRVLECGNGSKNHGVVASCSVQLLDKLKAQGLITGKEKDAIQRCVARAK